jgi:hypothetical protein
MPQALSAIGVRFYRVLLILYPARFRNQFRREMASDFEEASREALHAPGGWSALASLWAIVAADFVRSLAIQWLHTGLPLVAIVAAFVTSGTVSVLAWIWPSPPVAASSSDSDVVFLVLIAAVVLLIIASTIVFSLLFLRPLFYRRRG